MANAEGRGGGSGLTGAPGSRTLTALGVLCLLMVSLPVRDAFTLGQADIVPILLVLIGTCAALGQPGLQRLPEHASGLLVGVAAALQPAALLFAPLLWLAGRGRAAVTTAAAFAGCSLLAWAALPHDSATHTYWLQHITGTGGGEPADGLANQSLHGLLLRIGLHGPLEIVLFAALAVAVAAVGLRRAARYAEDGQLLLAVAVTGCVALAVWPTASWQHQQLWILLAAVGRVGRRSADRRVWPLVVVLVMTLSRDAWMPGNAVIRAVGANLPLLLALAAACALPFLHRSSPHWRDPVPTEYAARSDKAGRVPLLRFWRLPLSRPNLALELLLIRVGYWVYSCIRGSAPEERSLAEAHGRQILGAESFLHIDIEHWFNHAVADVPWLASSMNGYYSSFHFGVPLSILAWLYVCRPATYRWARTGLGIATLLALCGFWLYPLAPPRLMPDLGYIDTANGPQDLAKPEFGALTKLSNQYAAMPSLHVGWSLWCGLVLLLLAPYAWLRVLGMLYPLMTTLVILGTANHYVLDAVGGAAAVLGAFGLQYVLMGRTAKTGSNPEPPLPLKQHERPRHDAHA